ncbi:MAG: fused MFS/spermidine synthase [Chloroflexi bacterium]|nr:fused MFS/spermidine synthase [Chloroflexota bacterium]
MSALLARALVFASSAAVLVLEILAGRLVAPYVGITLETFTGIIGIVLAGIALGAWAGGYVADRMAPRGLIAPLLLVSGLLTIAIPTIVDAIGPAMRAAGPLEIVVLTLSAFFLPATTLSAIPSIVVKLRLRSLDETGSVVGSLSALGTIGALAGTFLTGFVLVAAAPTRPIVLGIGVLLLVAGVAMSAHLATRRSVVASLIAVAAATGWLAASPGPCDYETTYFCAVIEVDAERPTGRTFWLDALPHSYVDLADPTHLQFRYIKTMADLIDQHPEGPLAVAYVGGGGFTLPRYVNTVRPGSAAVVFEIDRALVTLVEQHLGLQRSAALRVETGDARLRLPAQERSSFDVVVGDAFGGLSVPWHLTTREFIQEVDRVLAPDGFYVINVIDFPPLGFARAEAATLRAVFPHIAAIAPAGTLFGNRGGNVVLVGSRQPLPREAIQARLDRRGDDEVILVDAAADQWVTDAQVLRDDFAPVDQLLTPPSH